MFEFEFDIKIRYFLRNAEKQSDNVCVGVCVCVRVCVQIEHVWILIIKDLF